MSKKYKANKNYLSLILSVIFLFIILNLVHNNDKMFIDLYGRRHKTNNEILIKTNSQYYISYQYIKENVDKEIYFDDISKKIVISSKKGLLKARIDDKKVTVNFENIEMDNVGVIENKDKYISLDVLEKAYEFDINVDSNTIYISSSNAVKGKIKKNHTPVYLSANIKSRIKFYANKKDKIDVISEHDNFVFVKINNKIKIFDHHISTLESLTTTYDIAQIEIENKNGKCYCR